MEEGKFIDIKNCKNIAINPNDKKKLIVTYKNKNAEYFVIQQDNSIEEYSVQYIRDLTVPNHQRTIINGPIVSFTVETCRIGHETADRGFISENTILNSQIKNPIFLSIKVNKDGIPEQTLTGCSEGSINFSHSIFTTHNTNFKNLTFNNEEHSTKLEKEEEIKWKASQKIDFSDSIFFQGILKFKNVTSNLSVIFDGSHFFTRVSFSEKIIFSNLSMHQAIFYEKVLFQEVQFNEKVKFMETELKKLVAFDTCTFKKNANFAASIFTEGVVFSSTKFIEVLNFSKSYINSLKFFNVRIKRLYLELSNIKQLAVTDINIYNASRDAFSILKHLSLKQSNNITALNFYKREYEQHFNDLKWNKNNWGDKLLLAIEKYTSNFGTSVIPPTLWLLGLNALLFSIFYYDEIINNCDISAFPNFIFPWLQKTASWSMLITIPLNSFLIYEIVKSFRRFSRKL